MDKQSVILLILLTVLGFQGSGLAEEQTYEAILFQEDVMIPMRDGVKLATDIYRPAINGVPAQGKFPIVFARTPYNKKGERFGGVAEAKYFAQHGYVAVLQDLRGCYKSEGILIKYMNEPEDGYDSIEWLAKLPYSDGKVGMWGTSYSAHVQANAAKLRPPHLKTVVLNMGGLYSGWEYKIRNHGALELAQQVGWAFIQIIEETKDPLVKELMQRETVTDWFRALPLKKGLNPLSAVPNFEQYIFDMMSHGDYDDYWKQMSMNWKEYFDKTADIPMIHITGWYDAYTSGTIKNYLALSKRLNSPVRLWIGPWTHHGNTRSFAGNVEFGSEASVLV